MCVRQAEIGHADLVKLQGEMQHLKQRLQLAEGQLATSTQLKAELQSELDERRAEQEANAWLESVAMRPLLERLLEAICKDKPDKLAEYAVDWMRKEKPDDAAGAEYLKAGSGVGPWKSREDVKPDPEELMVYLKDIKATSTLETTIEKAINVRPKNVGAGWEGVLSGSVWSEWWSPSENVEFRTIPEE